MLPSVRMVCEVDQDLIKYYPFDELLWKSNANGICGMLEEPPEVEEFFELLLYYFPRTHIGFNAASKVIPKQVIPVHTDRHDDGCKTRVHIPLKSDPHAYFYTGGKFFHMDVGKVYMIDPSEEHGVVNLGRNERIHLIFNMVH